MMDAPKLGGRWKDVREKHYLLASGPPPSRFTDVHAALVDQPGWRTGTVVGGHELMWTHPVELAATLLAIIHGQAC